MIADIDTNKDGQIDLAEFRAIVQMESLAFVLDEQAE